MFSNYSAYRREIKDAIASLPSERRGRLRRAGTASATSVASIALIAALGIVAGSGAAKMSAIQTVSASAIAPEQIELVVDNGNITSPQLASSAVANQSIVDEEAAKLTTQAILEQFSNIDPSRATVKVIDGKTHLMFDMENGTRVDAVIATAEDGSRYIESITANLTEDQLLSESDKDALDAERMENPDNVEPFVRQIPAYDADAVLNASGIDTAEMSDDEKRAKVSERVIAIDGDVLMALPDGFALEGEEAIGDDADASGSESGDGGASAQQEPEASAESSADSAGDAQAQEGNAAETTTDGMQEEVDDADGEEAAKAKETLRTYRSGAGTTMTVRIEDTPESISGMGGYVVANKMLGYWKETVFSISESSGQTPKNAEAPFEEELFYIDGIGKWGYRARVAYTDGTRDVVYNRVVVVDEKTGQMSTVSYRHDGAVDDAEGIIGYEDFKALFFAAPAEDDDGIGAAEARAKTAELFPAADDGADAASQAPADGGSEAARAEGE